MMFKVKITTAVVVGLILGVLYQGQEFDQAGIQNANGAMFMILTNLSFGSIFSICNSFCSELLVFLRSVRDPRRDIQALLSLVEHLHYCALIGRASTFLLV